MTGQPEARLERKADASRKRKVLTNKNKKKNKRGTTNGNHDRKQKHPLNESKISATESMKTESGVKVLFGKNILHHNRMIQIILTFTLFT